MKNRRVKAKKFLLSMVHGPCSIVYCLSFIICCLLFNSCEKDTFITSPNANLSINVDSVFFDTVFTTTGSITKSFKIFNNNSQKIKLNSVKLLHSPSSPFKLNINGIASSQVNNIEIAANDSMYVFVAVQIDPNNNNLPFLVTDSVQIDYNGNSRYVPLQAYGQNAIFLKDEIINANTDWNNDLPYVIVGSLKINEGAMLTIQEGCKIFSHANAPIIVEGTLIAAGTKENNIIFTGDRLDEAYKNLPAAWPGIYFRQNSINNVLEYTQIKNANQAIVVDKPSINANPKIKLHQCTIDNAFDVGIMCINSSLEADNCLISNCGNNIFFKQGGSYILTNCTAAGVSNNFIAHKNPVITIHNFATQNGNTLTADLNVSLINCIFWGDQGFVDDEIAVTKQGNTMFNVQINNCLYRAVNDPANTVINNVIKNQDPLFDSIDVNKNFYDFRISNIGAPGIDQGLPTIFLNDLDGNSRNVGPSDLGCYEKQ